MEKLEIQGDVALRPAALPAGAKKVTHKPLALGEHSGHAHVVVANGENPDAWDLFEIDGRMLVVTGGDGAQLRHMHLETKRQADHQPLHLEPNTCYEVILQNEFNPEADAFVRVAD
jgi:hypothetical protein